MSSIYSLIGNSQMLDGGAMFGNAPKAVWKKWIDADEQNRIPLACRALLLKKDKQNILFETGIGQFFEPKLRKRYGVVEDEHVLLTNLNKLELGHENIDVVVLSHLHFDHAGGLLAPWQENEPPRLLFPKAQFIVSKAAWQRAKEPHFRDRASFVPQLNQLLEESGRLHLVDGETSPLLGEKIVFHYSHGHTPGLLISELKMHQKSIYFCSDLIPAAPWVHLPITMGYDRYPELLIDEKQQLLKRVAEQEGYLYFTHDHQVAMAKVQCDEKGKYGIVEPLEHLDHWPV